MVFTIPIAFMMRLIMMNRPTPLSPRRDGDPWPLPPPGREDPQHTPCPTRRLPRQEREKVWLDKNHLEEREEVWLDKNHLEEEDENLPRFLQARRVDPQSPRRLRSMFPNLEPLPWNHLDQ
jgi:hypothetical protein